MGTPSASLRAAACLKLVFVTLCLAELLKVVAGANYIVGENFVIGGLWTNDAGPSNSKNLTLLEQYEAWAKSVNISVGDTLEFSYDDSHTVVLVPTRELYDACNYGTFVDVTSPSPPTIYTVADTQPLYFVCSIDQHCEAGQKVAITDISSAISPVPSVIPLPPAPEPSNQGHFFRPASILRSCLTFGSSIFLFLLVIS